MPNNPAFTVRHQGRVNVLKTPVKVSGAFNPNNPPKQVTYKQFEALWDTGATKSVICQRVVDTCNLTPISMTQVHHADGVSLSEVYSVSFVLRNNVIVPEVQVTKGKFIGGQFDVLIGMDIISLGDFAVTNRNKKTVFSFRIPSIAEIDFVKVETPHQDKIGRNQPCPCGSGKKHKKCCGS